MKKLLVIALLFFVSSAAMAESTTPPGKDSGKPEMSFEQRKAKALERMTERHAEMEKKMQEKEACVKAATTKEALQACFPKWKEHHDRKGGGDDDTGEDHK